MIVMYDSIYAGTVPGNAQAVAGYVDGWWPSFGALVNRFYGKAHCLSITVHGNVAACCDCEQGDLTPGQAVAWVAAMLGRGVWRPCVYASQDTWENQGLRAALAHYGPRIRRWVAAYPGTGRNIPAGYDAHQYTDQGPNGENVDISVCRDDFFPAPPPRKPKPKPPKPHPKVVGATAGAALIAALTAILNATHVHITPAESSAMATLAAALSGYITPAKHR